MTHISPAVTNGYYRSTWMERIPCEQSLKDKPHTTAYRCKLCGTPVCLRHQGAHSQACEEKRK